MLITLPNLISKQLTALFWNVLSEDWIYEQDTGLTVSFSHPSDEQMLVISHFIINPYFIKSNHEWTTLN